MPALKACWVIPLRGWKPTRIEAHKNQAHKNCQTDKNREVTVFILDNTLVCSFVRTHMSRIEGIVPVLVESSIEGDTRSQDKQSPL